MIDANSIGQNIRSARNEKGLTQRQLSEQTEISQTQLSDYENGNKTPGLYTLAKLSLALGKSMDELYFGDASVSFISSAPNRGRLIVNCIYQLWEHGVLTRHYPSEDEERFGSSLYKKPVADLRSYASAVERLLIMLDDFKRRKYTYKDPDAYLEQMLDSAAQEIGS
ncbi:MAG: helix-turn-helix transcriptional regulator [Actinomycetota bacterium]|nr:helix-turn-helix transcriptional regulator [Actinomycetota bacterium]